MSDNKDLLNKRKQSLLTELESIKHLLDNTSDSIPVLEQAVFTDDDGYYVDIDIDKGIKEEAHSGDDHSPQSPPRSANNTSTHQSPEGRRSPGLQRATLPASMFNPQSEAESPQPDTPPNKRVLPGQKSLFERTETNNDPQRVTPPTLEPQAPAFTTPEEKKKTVGRSSTKTLNNNPFLPKHVRKRLDQQAMAAEAAAQESASSASQKNVHTENASYTERLVDQLVAQYLPKIEAELREKLLDVVKRHEDHDKK